MCILLCLVPLYLCNTGVGIINKLKNMKKILYLLFVVTITNIQGIMAQEKITQTAGADGKAAFQREMIFPIGK